MANDQVFRTRFREESQIAASLDHPHVIPIHDFGSSGGLLYIAMRYVSGTDLRQLLAERGWLTPGAAVLLLAPAGAHAAVPYKCDSSALRLTLATAPAVEPITANQGGAQCANQTAGGALPATPLPARSSSAVPTVCKV